MAIETDGLARSFRYTVEIESKGELNFGGADIGFNSISGLGDETDSFEYREGNDTDLIHEYDGLTTINEVDLEKGYIYGNQAVQDLLRWRYHGSNVNGDIEVDSSTPSVDVDNGYASVKARRNVTIALNDSKNQPVKEFVLKDCTCRGLELSDFDAESSDALIQTFTIKPEGLKIQPANSSSSSGGAGGSIQYGADDVDVQ